MHTGIDSGIRPLDLWQAKGKANAPVSPQLRAALLKLVNQVNQWELHDRMRRRMKPETEQDAERLGELRLARWRHQTQQLLRPPEPGQPEGPQQQTSASPPGGGPETKA